jgi:uncharacterized cupin superfamily protein
MFFILEGEGTLRHSGETWQVKTGDIICCPVGSEHPHEILNSGSTDLKYLAVSTMEQPEVALYPDSDKYGVYVGKTAGDQQEVPEFRIIARQNAGVDYWDGE